MASVGLLGQVTAAVGIYIQWLVHDPLMYAVLFKYLALLVVETSVAVVGESNAVTRPNVWGFQGVPKVRSLA